MPSPDDIFYVIGFTRGDIAVGALRNLISLSLKSLEQMTKLHQRVGPLAIAAARGVVVKEPIEVYFESPLDAEPGRNFRKEYGENYETVQFLKRNSDEALQRVRAYTIHIYMHIRVCRLDECDALLLHYGN